MPPNTGVAEYTIITPAFNITAKFVQFFILWRRGIENWIQEIWGKNGDNRTFGIWQLWVEAEKWIQEVEKNLRSCLLAPALNLGLAADWVSVTNQPSSVLVGQSVPKNAMGTSLMPQARMWNFNRNVWINVLSMSTVFSHWVHVYITWPYLIGLGENSYFV